MYIRFWNAIPAALAADFGHDYKPEIVLGGDGFPHADRTDRPVRFAWRDEKGVYVSDYADGVTVDVPPELEQHVPAAAFEAGKASMSGGFDFFKEA